MERRLIDFQPGDSFHSVYASASRFNLGYAKSNALFLKLKLCDCTGERNATLWNAPNDILEQLQGTRIVRVRGFVERNGRVRGFV